MRWFPLAVVLLMVGAVIEALCHRNWTKAVFWALDAALTGVSAFALN